MRLTAFRIQHSFRGYCCEGQLTIVHTKTVRNTKATSLLKGCWCLHLGDEEVAGLSGNLVLLQERNGSHVPEAQSHLVLIHLFSLDLCSCRNRPLFLCKWVVQRLGACSNDWIMR